MNRIVICLSFLLVYIGSAGQATDQYFETQLKRFFNLYPQENAFLLVDNTTYIKGEIIRFKVYLWNNTNDQISDDVRVLLRDVQGKVLAEQRVLMADGEGQGDFEIEERIPNDIYIIELYSNWTQNFTSKPIAKRLVSISDGNPSIENPILANNSKGIVMKGTFTPGDYSRFFIFTGSLSPQRFQLEVLCNNEIVLTKEYESALVSDSIFVRKAGEYRVRVCMKDVNECFSESHGKDFPMISLKKPSTLEISNQHADHVIAVCTANSLLEVKSLNGQSTLAVNLSSYPAGLIYFLLVDKNAKRIVSAASTYHRAKDRTINTKVIVHGNETEEFPLTSIEIDPSFGKSHLIVQADNATTGIRMLGEIDEPALSEGLALHAFPLAEKIEEFLTNGSLPIAENTQRFDLRLEKPSFSALDFLLSELGSVNKVDATARYKKMIGGIQSDYSVEREPSYSPLPADDRYMPADYPTIYKPLEFLRQAIPRLKVKKPGMSESFHFLYTNLKDQKQLYESPATLIINGYKAPSFAFIDMFEKDEIVSINALYNSETLVSANLNTLLPGGAIEVRLKNSTNTIKKLAGLALFSIPYNWPHDLEPAGRIEKPVGPRFPLFATLYHWSKPYENPKSFSAHIPRARIQPTSISHFSMATVKSHLCTKTSLEVR